MENILILPVQRLYKYPLFFENLLHYTAPTHRDFESIQKALTDIREIAELVDARVAEVQRIKRLKAVQASLHPKFAVRASPLPSLPLSLTHRRTQWRLSCPGGTSWGSFP